jgi:hypothetical protein
MKLIKCIDGTHVFEDDEPMCRKLDDSTICPFNLELVNDFYTFLFFSEDGSGIIYEMVENDTNN